MIWILVLSILTYFVGQCIMMDQSGDDRDKFWHRVYGMVISYMGICWTIFMILALAEVV